MKILIKEGEFTKEEIPEFNEIYEMSEVSDLISIIVCLCNFAILYHYPCSFSDPSYNLVKCYQRENKHIINYQSNS